MNFDEKFIEKNIAALCEEYDKIKGANTNLARIAPDFVDGLKPVQRRALYIMYLKDQGKSYRKLATISGDTFGRVHPHSPTSIEDAIVNIEQDWHNSIPLIDGDGNWGTCHDKETEVLTLSGWKLFNDISYKDELASVDPETGNLIFEKPTNIIKYKFNGDLIVGKHNSLDFAVTPNHKMVVKKYNRHTSEFEKNFQFVEANQLPTYSRLINRFWQRKDSNVSPIILEEETISNGNVLPRVEIPMDVWVQFIGIFLADGNMYIDESKPYSYKVIHLSVAMKSRKIKYFSEILEKMGLKNDWSESMKGFNLINKRIWNILESYGLFGKRAPDKFVPDFIFNLDHSYIEQFLHGFYMGDGSKEKWGAISYYTSSEQMASQIQILLSMCGTASKIQTRSPRRGNINGRIITSDRNQYRIYAWNGKNQSIDRVKHISTSHYDDYVYCAEVPTYHTLVTKRNGCILVSGNCSGDPAGASRYIKARLSAYATACFFEDWKDSVVDMVMGYDEETKEPVYLPAKYPNVLLNGCLGIGYGMASNIPPFNFKEVVEACITLMADPDANIILIPDSPSGCDIIEGDFGKISDMGNGTYSMRCKYDIDAENNTIKITNLPYQISVNTIRERISDIKEKNGLPELISMNDLSGAKVDLQLVIRDDVNPYKFMRKLISEVAGLEKSYPVNISVTNDCESFDYSVKKLLVEWIRYRREQKRVVVTHKRTTLLAEQRTNDVKIFVMNKHNLDETIAIFRSSHNRVETEKRLIEKYRNSEIRMDSLQAKTLSMLRLYELNLDAYDVCVKRREELFEELNEVEEILNAENGIDKIIIAELRDGIKRFGSPRKSNVVRHKISISSNVEGCCILQLSSDGNIIRKIATNVYEEPVPVDNNGFAVRVDNDASFILVNEAGYYSFIRVKDLPVDTEVPVNRYTKQRLDGNIIAMLPWDMDSNMCCTLISKFGVLKRMKIADMGPSKKPCIVLNKNDSLIRGIITAVNSSKDILVYTKDGMGQRFDPNLIRITSPSAKGGNGFKLKSGDEIVGCYAINPEENQYILYVTVKGKMRLNLIEYLPLRDSKHDAMVMLISINDRDRLLSVVGCNKLDKLQVYFDDGFMEIVDISKLEEGTMSSDPKKVTTKNAVTTNIVKVKLV